MFSLRYAFVMAMLFSIGILCAQVPLSVIRGSGVYGSNQLDVLAFSHPGEELLVEAPGGISSLPMLPRWQDDLSWQSATIMPPPSGHIGFRNTNASLRVNPIYWGGSVVPNLGFYTPLESDATGDHLYNSNWLDITESRVTFSQDRLYFAIKNNHTSFPVSSGLTYFAYMPVLTNPLANPEDDPIVYGLMYTISVTGIISPGLYKITGTGFGGLTQIGEIEQSVEDQTLLLSCSLSDLLADPDFSTWFDPQQRLIATVTTTSRITLVNGIQQSDITTGATLQLVPRPVPIVNTFPPVLSNAAYTENTNNTISVGIDYFDADANFPRIASVSVDGGEAVELVPESYPENLFSGVVRFINTAVVVPETWSELHFSFSHGDELINYSLPYSTYLDDSFVPQAKPGIVVYPNPAKSSITILADKQARASYSVYNLRGQIVLVGAASPDERETILNVSQLKPGVYFIKTNDEAIKAKRFVKM